MTPKKTKNKRDTDLIPVKKTPLLKRRCASKDPGRGRVKNPWRKMKRPWPYHIGRSRRLINPK